MKLVTYEIESKEFWGFVIDHPIYQTPWVFNPKLLVKAIGESISSTGSNWLSKPLFRDNWPGELSAFLELEKGIEELKRLSEYLTTCLSSQSDQYFINMAGRPLDQVKLKAPIPRPRLYFGLVQNGTPFIRNNPSRLSVNFFPQGHNRPHGSVIGSGDTVVHQPGTKLWGYNVELGFVIGKKGRYIPPHEAMDYVAGYVLVTDACSDGFFNMYNGRPVGHTVEEGTDWFTEATLSWCGKMADTLAPMGPWLITKDEISNVYDLLAYNRISGLIRDRTYTGCYMQGIERLISWYSSFATLYPGDVLHLGTMGVDGLACNESIKSTNGQYLETEIERIGKITNNVIMPGSIAGESEDRNNHKHHYSPAANDLIFSGKDEIDGCRDWTIEQTRHFWTMYGNYTDVLVNEGIPISDFPRVLNAPPSSIGFDGAEIDIPPRATKLDFGIEFACVIKKLAKNVSISTAKDYILGYTPLLSVSDHSFGDLVVEPATSQERSIPTVYGRWADKFNIISANIIKCDANRVDNLEMTMEIDGVGSLRASTGEYVISFDKLISILSSYVTLFPGDVITLGRVSHIITLESDKAVRDGISVRGSVEKMGEIAFSIKQDITRKRAKLSSKSVVLFTEVVRGGAG